jgi:hypothetical protein
VALAVGVNTIESMGKIWVLDTSTKGTGAAMVPLEQTVRKPSAHAEPVLQAPAARPKPDLPPAPRQPRQPRLFRVVDISTRQTLAEGADAAATIEVLNGVRSIVDVNVYLWQPDTDKWRLLTFNERRLLWDARTGAGAASV